MWVAMQKIEVLVFTVLLVFSEQAHCHMDASSEQVDVFSTTIQDPDTLQDGFDVYYDEDSVSVSGDSDRAYLRLPRAESTKTMIQHELPAFVEIPRYYEVQADERARLQAAISDMAASNLDPTPLEEGQQGTCQYIFNVPKSSGPGCGSTSRLRESSDSRLDDMQAKMDAQQVRLRSIEDLMRNFQYELDKIRFPDVNGPSDVDIEEDDEEEAVRSSPYDLLNELRQQIKFLEDKLREVRAEKDLLEKQSAELLRTVDEKHNKIVSLTKTGSQCQKNYTSVQRSLLEAVKVNVQLGEEKKTFITKMGTLANAKRVLTHRLVVSQKENKQKEGFVRRCRGEKMRVMEARHECKVQLTNATEKILQMGEALQNFHTSRRSRIVPRERRPMKPCNSTSTCESPLGTNSSNVENTCGRLVSISEPVTISEARSSLGKYGVWMKDPAAQDEDKRDRIWSISTTGIQIKKLYQYRNAEDFCNHNPEREIELHVPMESTGATIYNGSMYYQRRNSRRIVKFDLSRQEIVKERPLKHAGFHGMFAYQWGGYSDIDFAVDESGLWVIYSTRSNKGNIVVTKLNPNNLRATEVIRTNIQKNEVSNAFIICGVLYTVNSFNSFEAQINYSFDLVTKEFAKVDVPFYNPYRFNVMMDYDPAERRIFAWDNGHQVAYQISLSNGTTSTIPTTT